MACVDMHVVCVLAVYLLYGRLCFRCANFCKISSLKTSQLLQHALKTDDHLTMVKVSYNTKNYIKKCRYYMHLSKYRVRRLNVTGPDSLSPTHL